MRRFVLVPVLLLATFAAIPLSTSAAGSNPDPFAESAVAPSSAPPFFPNVNIIDGSSPYAWQVEPTMAVNASGTIFVGWKEASTSEGPGRRVGFSYSEDGGSTWAPNILMPQNHTGAGCANSDPWMALAPDDRLYYAYLEYECGSGLDFPSTRDGRDWGPVYYLPGAGGLSDKESIAVAPSGRLYAAWDEAGLGNELQVTRSDDGGATWAPFVNPAASAVLGVIINVAPSGTVYIVWWNLDSDNIMFDWSDDGGITWHADKRINDVAGSAAGGGWQIPIPAMNVDPNTGAIYVAWPDYRNGNHDIFTTTSVDGGLTWSTNRRINDDTGSTTQYMVDLAIDSAGTVHAAWEDRRNGDWNIFYANSTDGGETWSSNLRVSDEDTPGSYNRPGDYFAIEAAPDDAIYVVWTDGRGADFDIFFARKPGYEAATVTIATEPVGRTIVVDGKSSKAPVQYVWLLGSTHTVGAPSPQPINPDSRYVWASWSDGGPQTHDIIAVADATVTAAFTLQYSASFDLFPDGPQILIDGAAYAGPVTFWWDAGSPHTLEAPSPQLVAADHRFVWASWSDGGDRVHAVVADGPYTVVATFQEEWTLLLETSPAGRSVFLDGVPYTGPAAVWLPPGTDHIVAVDSIQSGAPGVRYVFVDWSDGGAVSHVVAFGGTMTLTARFRTEYFLTVTAEVSGATGSGWYPQGATAYASVSTTILDVASGERLVFTGWSGDASGSGATSNGIVMDGPKAAIAVYTQQFYLNVQSAFGTPSGSAWYAANSVAFAGVAETEVSIESGTRMVFTGWTGGASGSGTTSAAIFMDGPKTAIANWRKEFLVTIVSDIAGVEGAGWYAAGATATLRAPAQATSGGVTFTFAGWSGGVSSPDATVDVVVNRPLTLYASWSPSGPSPASAVLSGVIIVIVVIGIAAFLVVWRRRRASR